MSMESVTFIHFSEHYTHFVTVFMLARMCAHVDFNANNSPDKGCTIAFLIVIRVVILFSKIQLTAHSKPVWKY